MPLRWRKVRISDETYEAAAVFDVDGDGVPDIVSGAFWYQGPDFRKKHFIGAVRAEGEYFDDFFTLPMDINGDGRLDFLTGGMWSTTLRWRENPGDATRPWPEHVAAETGNIETARAWDLDGDGLLEIVPSTPRSSNVDAVKLKTDENGRGLGEFERHTLFEFPDGQRAGHGLGCGDIAGHGRMDLVLTNGWLEAPAHPWREQWTWHPDFSLGRCSVPVIVADVNRDGLSDLIVGQAHDYGLDWWEQKISGGRREWIRHPIDPYNAQYHTMQWVDIDGDGACELVTGKRHRAHCGRDPGEWDDYGIYYFKWTGESFARQIICYGPYGESKGCGIQFATADLRGTGRLDLIAPGKDGLCVFFNEGL